MAGFFQQFGKGAADGFLGSPYLKDFRHASKTFLTNAYGNAPKFKYLFHVYFDINETKITDNLKIFPSTTNHGLLVKTVDLPKFTIPLVELNQYNRKRYIQTKINYDPVRITFHDDNINQIRNLWFAYYSYYFNDPSQPGNLESGPQSITDPGAAATALNRRGIYQDLPEKQRNWGYMGESGKTTLAQTTDDRKAPFFKSIKIFGFNQHNFSMYELINPLIENFAHDTYSYSESNGTMDCSMGLRYESVKYFEGAINGEQPDAIVNRFAEDGVYDKELSPIARPGNNRNILGQGGLVDAGNGILQDLSRGNILGAIQTAGRVSNTFKNSQQVLQAAKAELVKGAIAAASNPGTIRSVFNFPGLGSTNGPGSQNGNNTTPLPTFPPPIDGL